MAALYSSLKFLRFADHLTAVAEQRTVAPVHVRIKPTNRRNRHCRHCAYRSDDLQLGADMDEANSIPPAYVGIIASPILKIWRFMNICLWVRSMECSFKAPLIGSY